MPWALLGHIAILRQRLELSECASPRVLGEDPPDFGDPLRCLDTFMSTLAMLTKLIPQGYVAESFPFLSPERRYTW